MRYYHVTAMLEEAVDFLNCAPGKIIVDGTLGGFGHAGLICTKIGSSGTLIGIDQDVDAVKVARKIVSNMSLKTYILHDNFVNLPKLLDNLNISFVDGILLDLGMSLHQIQASGRGFSFLKDEPLDMRMNINSKITAATLLATLSKNEITNILFKYGEERWASRIANNLVRVRDISPIKTSGQLSNLIKKIIPKRYTKNRKTHPATRVFMALRIAVNEELVILDHFLKTVLEMLKPNGRLCILSFQSLEDRIVKNAFKSFEGKCACPSDFPVCVCNLRPVARILTRKVLRPSKREIDKNPMARSTRLRVVEKI